MVNMPDMELTFDVDNGQRIPISDNLLFINIVIVFI